MWEKKEIKYLYIFKNEICFNIGACNFEHN